MTPAQVKITAVRISQTPFPKSISSENVPKDGRRLRATNTRAKSIANDTVAIIAVMMVKMRATIEKACEARNRENPAERSAKPATIGWRTRTTSRPTSMMLTISGETPASLRLAKEEIL